MDYAIRINTATNDGQQRFSGTVGDDFCVNMAPTLQDAEDRCLSVGSATSLSFDSLCSEVGFVNLDFTVEGGRSVAIFSDSFSDQLQIAIDWVAVQSC